MKVLVTGAAGFIGYHLLKELAKEHLVYALVKPGQHVAQPRSCEKIELDLISFNDYHILPDQLDTIIHLAQSNLSFPEQGVHMFNVNTVSTQKLLDYGQNAGIRHFIFASSGSVYGSGPKPFTEDNPATCLDFYSYSKYASELLVHQYRDFFSTTILRLFFPYGPGQKNRLIPGLIRKIESAQLINIYNEGNPRINPIYISDLMEVFNRSLLWQGNLTLNIGGKGIYSIKEISEIIAGIYQQEARYQVHQDPDKKDLIGDITLMERMLGFSSKVDLKEGIKRMKFNG